MCVCVCVCVCVCDVVSFSSVSVVREAECSFVMCTGQCLLCAWNSIIVL